MKKYGLIIYIYRSIPVIGTPMQTVVTKKGHFHETVVMAYVEESLFEMPNALIWEIIDQTVECRQLFFFDLKGMGAPDNLSI